MAKWESDSTTINGIETYVGALGHVVMFYDNYRSVTLTPDEARRMSEALLKYASYGDKILAGRAEKHGM